MLMTRTTATDKSIEAFHAMESSLAQSKNPAHGKWSKVLRPEAGV